jgi:hypothetical protein
MGYYVQIRDANFVIPADKLDAAYAAMCALNTTHDAEKSGGSYSGGKQTSKYFAWMDANYPETCPDAKAILEALGFEVETYDNGDLTIDSYDSKAGQENLFIDACFPFVDPASYISWEGEDGEFWKQTPLGTKNGTVVYSE